MSTLGANAGFGGPDDPVRQIALKLRSLLAVNYSGSVFPRSSGVSDPEFPEVDCDEVHPGIYVGNA